MTKTHSPAFMAILALLLGASALQGCGSLGIGDDEFTCKTSGDGQPCASSWDVYKDTNNGRNPSREARLKQQGRADGAASAEGGAPGKNGNSDFVLDNYVTARLPDAPIPVRTPPQVMRVWIAPYEDVDGDFVVSGYVYSEISPRRWTLGVNDQASDKSLYQPLAKDK